MKILGIAAFTLFTAALLIVAVTIALAPEPSGACTLGICF